MADELAGEIDAIAEAAGNLSLTIVLGTFDEGKLPVVNWDTQSPSTWKTYLATAKNLGCPLVILEKYEFDQTALEELVPEQTGGEDGKSSRMKSGPIARASLMRSGRKLLENTPGSTVPSTHFRSITSAVGSPTDGTEKPNGTRG
jgi:hypothetical protein